MVIKRAKELSKPRDFGSVASKIMTIETNCTDNNCNFLESSKCDLGFRTKAECDREYNKKGGGEFSRRLDQTKN